MRRRRALITTGSHHIVRRFARRGIRANAILWALWEHKYVYAEYFPKMTECLRNKLIVRLNILINVGLLEGVTCF